MYQKGTATINEKQILEIMCENGFLIATVDLSKQIPQEIILRCQCFMCYGECKTDSYKTLRIKGD
jgi:hypothetical protein